MALASLRFQRNAQDYEESRQGMTVFAGDAASFHEWQFRLQIKKSLCTAEELPALTAKVVDALRGEALSCAMEIGLAKLMEANGLDLLVQKVQERLFPQRTAEARELLKQGMRIGGPMSRVPGEPMTSYISRRRRWWTLVHEMDNTLELGDTVQGSMMLEQAGLSRFDQNMVLTYTKGQRTMTATLLEQHYDVHHRGRETPTPTGNSSSPNRWRRRDTTRAYLAEADPIKELTDTAAYWEEGIPDDYDGEQDETEDDDILETDLAALLGNSGEESEADDALAEACFRDVQDLQQLLTLETCLAPALHAWRSAADMRLLERRGLAITCLDASLVQAFGGIYNKREVQARQDVVGSALQVVLWRLRTRALVHVTRQSACWRKDDPRPSKLRPDQRRGLQLVPVHSLRYSQESISKTFRDGRAVQETAEALASGKLAIHDLPRIRVVDHRGVLFTMDNRRLSAMREAFPEPTHHNLQIEVALVSLDDAGVRREWVRKCTVGTSVNVRSGESKLSASSSKRSKRRPK